MVAFTLTTAEMVGLVAALAASAFAYATALAWGRRRQHRSIIESQPDSSFSPLVMARYGQIAAPPFGRRGPRHRVGQATRVSGCLESAQRELIFHPTSYRRFVTGWEAPWSSVERMELQTLGSNASNLRVALLNGSSVQFFGPWDRMTARLSVADQRRHAATN